MRIHHLLGSGVMMSFLAFVPACALDGDEDPLEAQSPDEAQNADEAQLSGELDDAAAAPDDPTEIGIAATPTCNWVASYAGAWVPMYTGTNTVDCNMVIGTHSAGVRQLQHSMNLCYGEHLVEDSDFGPATRDALIRTQRKAGTTADGEYGPNTRRAMFHERIGGGCIRVP